MKKDIRIKASAAGLSRKRLLIVTTVPSTLASILRTQPRFLAQYYDIHLASSAGDAMGAVAAEEGVPVHTVPMRRGINVFADLYSLYFMMRLFFKIKPDAIHSYTPKAGLISMLAGWILRVPVRIHTFTGLIFPTATGNRRRLLIAVDRLICACATNVIPESNGVKDDLERVKITRKPLSVIGYGNVAGVDVQRFDTNSNGLAELVSTLKSELQLGDLDFVFVFVGRLNKDKGIDELLTAFRALPSNARLLIVGRLDYSSPISESSLNEIKNSPRICWIGPVNDVRPALALANVLVLPSYREGFPNVVLEAGAMSIPVIATDISGSNEAITPGVNGWIVPVRDAESLAGAMLVSMHLSKTELTHMGEQARERVVARFERNNHLTRMLHYYETLFLNVLTK